MAIDPGERPGIGAARPPATLVERLRLLRDTVAEEGKAVLLTAASLSTSAVRAAEMTANCEGCVIVTGVGKAGLVGQKLVATLASTGTPAHFLHPSEAVHGDLGRVRKSDLVWAISNSGRSEEVVRIAPHLKENSGGLIAITSTEDNPLASLADCTVAIGNHTEACPNGLAPTTSTTVMIAVGDGIAMLTSQLRAFSPQEFARYHPGGALGRKLTTVDQMMRPLEACRIASDTVSIRQAIVTASKNGRRTGALMLLDDTRRLTGIFTDSDLARLLEQRADKAFDDCIATRMTTPPTTIEPDATLQDAIAVLSSRRISELPVIDSNGCAVGLVDVTDVVALTGSSESAQLVPFPTLTAGSDCDQ